MSERVVSLVPSLTETMFDLQLGHTVVGVTRYCVEPQGELEGVPTIGGTKNPKLDQIASLEPDVVLVNTEENRREDIEWLGERFEVFESMPRSITDVADLLRELGRRFECWDAAEALILEIQAEMTRIQVDSIGLSRVRVFYPIWRKPWMSVNRDTYIHAMLAEVGADNVCADLDDRYMVVTDEVLRDLDVELVLLPSEPYEFRLEHQTEVLRSGLFPGCLALLVDGRDFCWHGSRTGRALGRLHDFMRRHRRAVGNR